MKAFVKLNICTIIKQKNEKSGDLMFKAISEASKSNEIEIEMLPFPRSAQLEDTPFVVDRLSTERIIREMMLGFPMLESKGLVDKIFFQLSQDFCL
jgi:hypothetical protein